MYAEVKGKLLHTKFDAYAPREKRLRLLVALLFAAERVTVHTVVTECRDPKDNKFLELAVDGKAKYIITGDTDLLILNPFRGIKILTPRDFLEGVIKKRKGHALTAQKLSKRHEFLTNKKSAYPSIRPSIP